MLGAQLKMFSAKDFFLDQNYSKCSFSQMKNATFISEDTLRVKAACGTAPLRATAWEGRKAEQSSQL